MNTTHQRLFGLFVASRFALAMGLGSVLGLARGFAVSSALDPGSFGIYAVTTSLGLFIGPLLGLGKIEDTRKRFPRMFVDGDVHTILKTTDRITLLVIQRAVVIVALVMVGAGVWGRWDVVFSVAIIGVIATCTAWAAVLASALRAGRELGPLAAATVLRAIIAITLVIFAARNYGLQGALVAEAVATVLSSIVMRQMLMRFTTYPANISEPPEDEQNAKSIVSRDGMFVFLGGLAATAQIYLSRPAVGFFYSPLELGTFSFLMLFLTATTTGIGICDQAYGPKFVRMQHERAPIWQQLALLARYLLIIILSVATIAIAIMILQYFDVWPWSYYSKKYVISFGLLLPTFFLCMLQISSSIDWMLQSHNREQVLLWASVSSLLIFAFAAPVIHAFKFPFVYFLWAFCLAKGIQIMIQITGLLRLR
jgi:O-antigen/teichoic acid export membrane protein